MSAAASESKKHAYVPPNPAAHKPAPRYAFVPPETSHLARAGSQDIRTFLINTVPDGAAPTSPRRKAQLGRRRPRPASWVRQEKSRQEKKPQLSQ